MSTQDNLLQVLIEALTSCNFKKVLQILHEGVPFSSDKLSECLLYYVKKISPTENISGNKAEKCIPCMHEHVVIYMLLDSGADIDKIDENGNTCLFYAALAENYQLCNILLQCGADMWADTEHKISIYDFVLEKSMTEKLIDTFNKFYPGLWKAVEYEDIYQVRQLINYWCRTNLHKNGLTLKEITLQTGNEEIINLILGVCESMDLVYHIFAKNTKAVKEKLETCKKKIRLNLRKMSDHGAPILYYLIQSRDVSTIELFIKHDCQIYTMMRDNLDNDMPVLFSALTPDMSKDVLEALLPKEKIQMEDILYKILYKGMTLLEVALEKKVTPDIFKLLIDRGGPLLLCDHNQFNETVLDVAITHNCQPYIDAVDECVHKWIHNPVKYGDRRLKLALLGWRFEPVQYLESSEITENVTKFLFAVNILQEQIENMSLAIENGDIQKFVSLKNAAYDKMLCETNMLWHARVPGDGMPLLHRAVLFNRPEIVDHILSDKPLKESIDNLFDQHHRTALHYAYASSKTKEIQKLLLNYGCSEHVLDKINREPLDFKDKQDSPVLIKMIDDLKSKNYSDYAPDPWNIDLVNDVTRNHFQQNESYFINPENIYNNCDNEHDEDEFYENEYENFLEDEESDYEEEDHSRCLIS